MRFGGKAALLRSGLAGVLAAVVAVAGAAAQSAGGAGERTLSLRVSSEFKSAKEACPTPSSSKVIEIDLTAPPVAHRASTGWLDFTLSLGGPDGRSVVVAMVTPVSPPQPIVVPIDYLYERRETTIYTTMRIADHPRCRGLILYFTRL